MAALSASVMQSEVERRIDDAVDVVVLDSVGSTNTWLSEYIANNRPTAALVVCATEHQTAGRGRRGKSWHTPKNGVTFSVAITVAHSARDLSGLSLLCGAAVCDVLQEAGLSSPRVKWPNDILVEGAKLAGILVEIGNSGDYESTVIIGTGLNYRRGEEVQNIDQSSTDLFALLGESLPERSQLIGAIAAEIYQHCQGKIPQKVSQLVPLWPQYDALAGKIVEVDGGPQTQVGRVDGIDAYGRLRVITERGEVAISAGNVSIRPQ